MYDEMENKSWKHKLERLENSHNIPHKNGQCSDWVLLNLNEVCYQLANLHSVILNHFCFLTSFSRFKYCIH
jgi:hypothetical protein